MRYELTTDETNKIVELVQRFLAAADSGVREPYKVVDISDRLTSRSFVSPILCNMTIMTAPAFQGHGYRSVMIAAANGNRCCTVTNGLTQSLVLCNVDVVAFTLESITRYLLPPQSRWLRFKFWMRYAVPAAVQQFKLRRLAKEQQNHAGVV